MTQWLKSEIIHTVTYIFGWLVLTGIDGTVVKISNNTQLLTFSDDLCKLV